MSSPWTKLCPHLAPRQCTGEGEGYGVVEGIQGGGGGLQLHIASGGWGTEGGGCCMCV